MVAPRRPLTFAVTARGPAAVAGLLAFVLFGFCGVPRLLSSPPTPAEARESIRDLRIRRITTAFLPRLEHPAPESARGTAEEFARALEAVRRDSMDALRVRRSWVGPPFAKGWAWVVEVPSPGAAPATYRIRRGIAMEAPRVMWYVPLF